MARTHYIFGRSVSSREFARQFDAFRGRMFETLEGPGLPREAVIRACGRLARNLNEREHLPVIRSLGFSEEKAREELALMKFLFSRECLEERVRRELPTPDTYSLTPLGESVPVVHRRLPIGVIFHIAAGNMDALPAYSVIEGLLAGNINLVKLPGGDNGLSLAILRTLISMEPVLREYIHVFDVPSEDIKMMQRLAGLAGAVVVWGGDEAVAAVRRLATPETRIIEWGHKLSFAYVSWTPSDEELAGIAYNICDTNQVLCSSCQGIFVDSADFSAAAALAERFLPILEKAAVEQGAADNLFIRAQKSLEIYTEELESFSLRRRQRHNSSFSADKDISSTAGNSGSQRRVFRAAHCSVIAYADSQLAPSHMFRNCWVRPLPKADLLRQLYPHKNHLQTAALLAPSEERGELTALLLKAGVVRVTDGRRMSGTYCGMPHDGTFPLEMYTRTVTYDGL